MGRIDDVLNVSGHRLGTMEIESALVANPLVAEAAVVGRPDDLTGRGGVRVRRAEAVAARRRGAEKIAKELRDWVAKEIGPIAKPKDIRFGENLPKTRSGRSCGGCCARSRRARPSRRTCRPSRTRGSSTS
jgi:acetyl-CoA synthetase